MKNKYLVLVFFLSIATAVASAGCTLQLHGYDLEGDGWERGTISILDGNDSERVLVENFTVINGYQKVIEFYCDTDLIEIRPENCSGTDGDFIRITDSANHCIITWSYSYDNYNFREITCSITDTLVVQKVMAAIPDSEPPCHDDYVDITNGGCDALPFRSQELIGSNVYAGSTGSYLLQGDLVYDYDWYSFIVDEPQYSNVYLTSDFPVEFELFRGSDCESDRIQHSETYGGSAGPAFTGSLYYGYQFAPGTYYIRIFPKAPFTYPCTMSSNYIIQRETCNLDILPAENLAEEMCLWNSMDVTNGGCFAENRRFSKLEFEYPVKGAIGQFGTLQGPQSDEDWYQFTLWESGSPELIIATTAPITTTAYAGACENLSQIGQMSMENCTSEVLSFDQELLPGTYFVAIKSAQEIGTYCDSEYYIKLVNGQNGDSCGSPRFIDLSQLENPTRVTISIPGDTSYAKNCYSVMDYDCGEDLTTPEFVGLFRVPHKMAIQIDTHETEWDTRLIVTRSWPPEECFYSDSFEDTEQAGLILKGLNPDTDYFVFVEGAPGCEGIFSLNFTRHMVFDEGLHFELELNQNYFIPGSDFILDAVIYNSFPTNQTLDICIILDFHGQFFFYPDWTQDFNTDWDYIGIGESRDTILEFQWPETSTHADNLLIHGACLYENTTTLFSNIDTVSFGFGETN